MSGRRGSGEEEERKREEDGREEKRLGEVRMREEWGEKRGGDCGEKGRARWEKVGDREMSKGGEKNFCFSENDNKNIMWKEAIFRNFRTI